MVILQRKHGIVQQFLRACRTCGALIHQIGSIKFLICGVVFALDVIDSAPYYPAIKTVWSWKKKTKAGVGRLYVVHTTAEQILGTFCSNDYSSKKLHFKTKIWVMVRTMIISRGYFAEEARNSSIVLKGVPHVRSAYLSNWANQIFVR